MMKRLLLLLWIFIISMYNLQAQCNPGEDTTAPVFGDFGDGTLAKPFRNLSQETVGNVPSGTYYFNFNSSTFLGELDNDTDGGGWLMILNYVHLAGDNSDLTVRNTDLPLLGSSTLGDNEAGTANWGHFGNALASDIDFKEIRFYAETSGHSRIINFKTDYAPVLEYVKTGSGSFSGLNDNSNYSPFSDHTAFAPGLAGSGFNNAGNLALTNFPFYAPGNYHWGIRGLGNRWEVDDFAINTQSTIHRVWVRGDLSPIGANSIIVSLDETGNITISPDDFGPNATDNCSTVVYTLSQTEFDCNDIGSNDLLLTATDDQNNATTIDVTVIIEDTTGPEITITTDLSIPFVLDPITNTVSITAVDLGLTATDNCELQSITMSNTDFDCNTLWSQPITITATDINGNMSNQDIRVTISDPIPPSISCISNYNIVLDGNGEARLTPEDVIAEVSDNCNVNTWLSKGYFDCSDIGEQDVTIYVADNGGNSSQCIVTVTVDVECVSDIILDNDPNLCGAIYEYIGCYTLVSGLESGSIFPIGTTTNVIEITDSSGTTSQCSFDVTVNDTQAPLYEVQDQFLVLDQNGSSTITVENLIGAHPSAPKYTVQSLGTFDPTDISSTGTEIILEDDEVSTALPIGFSFNFYGLDYTEFYISSNGFITFSDEDENGCCDGDILPNTNTPNNLIAFDWTDLNPSNEGTIRYTTIGTAPNRILIVDFNGVEYYETAPDATTIQIKLFEGTNYIEIHSTSTLDAGNDKTQGLENIDGTEAVVVPKRNSTVWTSTNEYIVFAPVQSAYDNCGIDEIVISRTSFDCTDLGINEIDVTVTDIHGNRDEQTAMVTITASDTTPPIISLTGENTLIISRGSGYTELGASTDDGSPVSIDNSDFIDTPGTYTIRYNATDLSCNHAIEVLRTVTVTPCAIDMLADTNFEIETNSLTCPGKNNGILTINATENLDYIVTMNNEFYTFNTNLVIENLASGVYTTCIAIDGNENCTKCYEIVIEGAPVLTGKTSIDSISNKIKVDIESGTAPYTVAVDNKIVGEYTTKSFEINIKNGNVIEIFSKDACQGKITTKINVSGDINAYPNPTRKNATLSLPITTSDQIQIEIHNALGVRVLSGVYEVFENNVELPLQDMSAGVYFVTINQQESTTLRIIKQ
ncbi:T9SS type A sorting domain-containing protein [Aquimarina pacifica]|uniref:T9SS type A sorting domain-containing protein n=1 Tax=Aquimarina pacifica TaxID=1296415 RepID=UPI0004B0E26F|nr:T9SS type A sorting domain-containing protein [Aquimarina pacifica]